MYPFSVFFFKRPLRHGEGREEGREEDLPTVNLASGAYHSRFRKLRSLRRAKFADSGKLVVASYIGRAARAR